MTNLNLKKTIQIFLLITMLIFTTKFFQSTPFETIFFQIQAGFLGIILLFLLLYLLNLIVKKNSIDKVVFYFLLLILFMPIYSAYRANVEFGQPYFYGILSQRDWLLLGSGIWVYYILITKKVTISTIEKSFLFMTYTSLLIFTFFVLLFDPSQLGEGSKFASMTEERGLRFKFQYFFITFGSIYFFIKYSLYKRVSDLLIFILFLGFVVVVIQGRTYMIILASVFFVYYYFNYSFSKFTIIIINNILLVVAILITIQMISPDFLEKFGDLFMEMFKVIWGEESKDMSSNARLWTSDIVLNYFDTHPTSIWLGTGRVSSQWNEGYERLFGYFYPEDIGLLGGMFLYGSLGLVLLLLIPLILEIKEIKKAKDKDDVFIQTIKYMLILSILRLVQGGLYFGANIWIVLFFILYAHNRLKEKEHGK